MSIAGTSFVAREARTMPKRSRAQVVWFWMSKRSWQPWSDKCRGFSTVVGRDWIERSTTCSLTTLERNSHCSRRENSKCERKDSR